MTYSEAVGAITPGELELCRQEWKISPDGFADRVLLGRTIDRRDEIIAALVAGFEDQAR